MTCPSPAQVHPMYTEGIPAIEEVRFSICHNRGCFGGCNFCALAFHQGRMVTSRSHRIGAGRGGAADPRPKIQGLYPRCRRPQRQLPPHLLPPAEGTRYVQGQVLSGPGRPARIWTPTTASTRSFCSGCGRSPASRRCSSAAASGMTTCCKTGTRTFSRSWWTITSAAS